MLTLRIIPIIGFVIILTLIVGKTFQLKRKGIQTSTTKRGIRSILVTTFLLAFHLLFITELLVRIRWQEHSLLPGFLSTEFHASLPIPVIGSLFIALSILCLYFTLQAFKDSLRFGLNAGNRGKLINSGIFSMTRNPFFISIELFLIGTAMILPTPFFISIAVGSVISIHFYVLNEENFLTKHYGKEYLDYCKKVRRYV